MAARKAKKTGAKKAGAKRKRARTTASNRAAVQHSHEEDDIDGCELDFHEEPTPDHDLPPARGGVEEPKRRSRRA